jgi:hypothetical protein
MQSLDVPGFLAGAEINLPEISDMMLRRLGPHDYNVLLRFRAEIVSAIANPDVLRLMPHEEEFVEYSVHASNLAEGIFHNGKLVAYDSLFLPNSDDDLRSLHIYEHARKRAPATNIGSVGGIMVDAVYRGRGLQRLLARIRRVVASELGRPHHFATIGFANHFSWRNGLSGGWRLIDVFDFTDPRYGPTSRMLLYRNPAPQPLSEEKIWIDPLDISRQRTLLGNGLVGTEYRMSDGRVELAYQRECD